MTHIARRPTTRTWTYKDLGDAELSPGQAALAIRKTEEAERDLAEVRVNSAGTADNSVQSVARLPGPVSPTRRTSSKLLSGRQLPICALPAKRGCPGRVDPSRLVVPRGVSATPPPPRPAH
jgi:hypothetical protein